MVTYPGDWEEKAVTALTKEVITGGTPSTARPDYWDGDIPWLSSTEIHQRRVFAPTRYITLLGLNSSSAKIAPKGSVLIALAGQGKTRGTAALLMSPMALNQSLAALVANEETDSRFLFYLFSANYSKLRELSSGDGGRGGLNKRLLRSLSFTVPSAKEEQEAIAETIAAFDTHISNLAALIEKKRAIRDAALEDLVSGRTRLAGFTEPWTESSLGSIGTFTKGAPLSKADISETGTPFILYGELYTTYSEVTYKVFRHTKKQAQAEHYSRIGDVIIPTSGETAEEIATACCVMIPDVILAGDLNIYRTSEMDGRFLSYVINHVVNRQISELAQGISIIHVNAKALGKIVVRYPSMKEQSAIVKIIDSMDEELLALEAEREKMTQIREGVMDDLLTGRKRLNQSHEPNARAK